MTAKGTVSHAIVIHQDSKVGPNGTAWYATSADELRLLCIDNKISAKARQFGETVYLHEDADAMVLINRLEELRIKHTFKLTESDSAVIAAMPSYNDMPWSVQTQAA